ncbi:hypothetical protein PF008_g33315, partial [Phytophthora fragariae]
MLVKLEEDDEKYEDETLYTNDNSFKYEPFAICNLCLSVC